MFGKQLAIESPVEADIVSAVPESSIPMAYGILTTHSIKSHYNNQASAQ